MKTLMYYFGMPVLSFGEIDKITGHNPNMFTWMSKALLWLALKEFYVCHIENISYPLFAKQGKRYLKTIWDKETFEIQNRMSNLDSEQKDAITLVNNKKITLVNRRLDVNTLSILFEMGFFIMISVNPNVLNGKRKYGSHMIIITDFKNEKVRICDPDKGFVWYKKSTLERAISSRYKPDFSATLVVA